MRTCTFHQRINRCYRTNSSNIYVRCSVLIFVRNFHLLTSCFQPQTPSLDYKVVTAFPIRSFRPFIPIMQTRRQSIDAKSSKPWSGVIETHVSGESFRVVSPDTACRPIVLCGSSTDNNFSGGNDEFSTTLNQPKGKKRRKTIKAESSDSGAQESLRETELIKSPSKSSPIKTKRSETENDDIAVVSTPIAKTRPDAVVVTPNFDESKRTKAPLKRTPNIVSISAPKDWLDTYNLVKELRHDRTAPCDHSGCEALPDKTVDPITRRFQVLICLMLSSQTKDAVVGAAIRSMQADKVLNIHTIHEMDSITLDRYIQKVGFHNNKTKYIKQAVQILIDMYNGDIPRTADEMIQDLPGIGPKMAYIIESVAWNTQSGIGVDTHMHRIFNVLHWVHATNTPEKTRLQLESWLPYDYWSEVNLLWVGFGQEVQQEKPKLLRKALNCSRPNDALRLIQRCGLDYRRVGKELDIMDEIETVLQSSK